MNEIIGDLPRRYVAWSSCFRREAGSYGKDTRGIIRVHQFDKVEMFSYCDPDDAHEEHLRLLAWEKEMLAKVELPYRVIDTAGGDLGTSAARKYDCEAWVPTQERYRELTSTSNCTDFQARRLSVRFRDANGRTRPVATLNGTLATTRWIVAILENHQQTGRLGARPQGVAAVPGPRGARTPRQVTGPMTPPRLVATDLDGTTVRSDFTVSERTVKAFARVERAGALLVMVTGRPPRWMHPVADAVGHRGVAICANGALVYDLHTEQVVGTHLMTAEALREAIEVLAEALPGLGFAVEYGDGIRYAHDYELSGWDSLRHVDVGRAGGARQQTGRQAARPASRARLRRAARPARPNSSATSSCPRTPTGRG